MSSVDVPIASSSSTPSSRAESDSERSSASAWGSRRVLSEPRAWRSPRVRPGKVRSEPCTEDNIPTDVPWRIRTGHSAHADEADGVAGRVYAARHLIARVALDGVNLPVRVHALHDADVLVEDDQVARLGRAPGVGRIRTAGALRPGIERIDGTEALALVANRGAGLARCPGDEVGAPRSRARVAGRGSAVLRDPRRVVGTGRLLGLTHLARGGGHDARAHAVAGDGGHRSRGGGGGGSHRALKSRREGRTGRRSGWSRLRRGEGAVERLDPSQDGFETHHRVVGKVLRTLRDSRLGIGDWRLVTGILRFSNLLSPIPYLLVGPFVIEATTGRCSAAGWPARACSCRPAAGSGPS